MGPLLTDDNRQYWNWVPNPHLGSGFDSDLLPPSPV